MNLFRAQRTGGSLNNGRALGCLMFFGLPFLFAGLGVLAWAAYSWSTYLSARSWQPADAAVLDLEFETHSGDDGDTYSVAVKYEYTFNGRTVRGDRVDIMGASSSNYRHHRVRYEELLEHKQSGEPITVWVNPEEPTRSVIYREADTWMYAMIPFGLVFASAGIGMFAAGAYSMHRSSKLAEIAAHDANRLWNTREDWAKGFVKPSTGKEMLVGWGFGLGLTVFLSIFVIVMLSEGAPTFAWVVIGIFSLIAFAMLARAISTTLRYLVHGTPMLYLGEVPIVPGRTVTGAVRTHKPLATDRWTLQLKCFLGHASNNSSSDAKRQMREITRRLRDATGQHAALRRSSWRGSCAYSERLSPAGEPTTDSSGRIMLPVSIAVPDGVSACSLEAPLTVTWVLEVKARAFPLSFSASFDLPVFYADEEEIERPSELA